MHYIRLGNCLYRIENSGKKCKVKHIFETTVPNLNLEQK